MFDAFASSSRAALGDVVQSLPLLSVLRERFPHAEISWVINHEFADLLEGHPLLHELLHFHRRGGATHYLQLLQDLRQRQFDLVFDLQGLMRLRRDGCGHRGSVASRFGIVA